MKGFLTAGKMVEKMAAVWVGQSAVEMVAL